MGRFILTPKDIFTIPLHTLGLGLIIGATQILFGTSVKAQQPMEQMMFQKELAQGQKLVVKRHEVSVPPPSPQQLEEDRKYLTKMPPGTQLIKSDHAYKYSFDFTTIDANGVKHEEVLWSPSFYTIGPESLTSLVNPVAQILDATVESHTLIVTYKARNWGRVFANIIQKGPDGYKELPGNICQLDLDRDNESMGPITNSAVISGTLKDQNLTITTKDTSDYSVRFLWKNEKWEKQPGPPRPKREEKIPPRRQKSNEPPPPESSALWKEKPGTKYEGEGLYVKHARVPAGKAADFTESISLLPAEVKATLPQATELFWAEDHHWQNVSTGPQDDFGWMSFYALWSRRVNAGSAGVKSVRLKFFDALHEPIGAKADVAGAFAVLFQQDGVLLAAITRPGDKGARAVMTDTAATLQTGIIGEQIKSAKFSGSIAAGTLAVEAQFQTGPSKRWTLKSQDGKDQWMP